MASIPIDPDYVWNYSFCEWIDLGVEINKDWYSVGNIKYNALNDLLGDFPQLFEEDDLPINGWDKLIWEPIEPDEKGSMDEGNILLLIRTILLVFVSEF